MKMSPEAATAWSDARGGGSPKDDKGQRIIDGLDDVIAYLNGDQDAAQVVTPTSAEQGVEAELAQMLEAATPGPWEQPDRRSPSIRAVGGPYTVDGNASAAIGWDTKCANAALIVAAVNALPRLLSIASDHARLKAENAALRAAGSGIVEWYDRDGSVGGIVDPMDDLRAALQPAQAGADEGGKS